MYQLKKHIASFCVLALLLVSTFSAYGKTTEKTLLPANKKSEVSSNQFKYPLLAEEIATYEYLSLKTDFFPVSSGNWYEAFIGSPEPHIVVVLFKQNYLPDFREYIYKQLYPFHFFF